MTVVLYYHQLGEGRSPLDVSPGLFSQHLEVLHDAGVGVLTARELAAALRDGEAPERAVTITFDDAFAAAVAEARTRLADANMRATFFCVAGHLGGRSDWPSRLPGAAVEPLASVEALRELARDGHELGSHGWSHAPLDGDVDLEREVLQSKVQLEAATESEVRTFAYPYGARPSAQAAKLVDATYDAAFTTEIGRVTADAATVVLPRVDAHYVRDPRVLRRVVSGSFDSYLGLRRVGSRTRRTFRKDYVPVAAR